MEWLWIILTFILTLFVIALGIKYYTLKLSIDNNIHSLIYQLFILYDTIVQSKLSSDQPVSKRPVFINGSIGNWMLKRHQLLVNYPNASPENKEIILKNIATINTKLAIPNIQKITDYTISMMEKLNQNDWAGVSNSIKGFMISLR